MTDNLRHWKKQARLVNTVVEHHIAPKPPSRAIWFGIGLLTGTIATLVILALVH